MEINILSNKGHVSEKLCFFVKKRKLMLTIANLTLNKINFVLSW